MIKAIAWDIDGTLVDSEPLHLFALQEVCGAFGVDISDLPNEHFVGVHIGNVWQEIAPRFPASLIFAQWAHQLNTIYAANAARLTEIEGAATVVHKLTEMGLRQIAVSNSNRAVVDANLSELGITDALDFSLSLDDVLEGKPDPFPYRLACSALGLKPASVLAVEDSATGAASALSAGLSLVFLTKGEPSQPERSTPIKFLSQLPAVIEALSGSGDPDLNTRLSQTAAQIVGRRPVGDQNIDLVQSAKTNG